MTRVFLLRHGETATPHVFHGAESDVGLSERGRRQAEIVAPLLAIHHPVVVVSSAMRRARDTATPIATACAVPLRIEPELHERRIGAMAGQAFQSTQGVWPETLRRWCAGELDYAPAGTESFAAIRERVLPVWQLLTTEYTGLPLVIVAHGVVCKVLLLSVLSGWSPADWDRLGPVRNTAISELQWTGTDWQALRLNELPEAIGMLDSAPGASSG